jgi:hypothetical protein
MWAVVAVGVAILAIAVAAFVLLRQRRRMKPRDELTGQKAPREPWKRSDRIAVAGIAVGALLTAVPIVRDAVSNDDHKEPQPVRNVYNLPERRALDILADQGFTNIKTIVVCSDSVPEGRVREVVLDKDSDPEDEIVVVNEDGDNPNIEASPRETRLLLKVSTGRVC